MKKRMLKWIILLILLLVFLLAAVGIYHHTRPSIPGSVFTWDNVFTEVDGQLIFAGIPRDMRASNMKDYYGMTEEEFDQCQLDDHANWQQDIHDSSELFFELDGAKIRMYPNFRNKRGEEDDDPTVFKLYISLSPKSSGQTLDEFFAWRNKMEETFKELGFEGFLGFENGGDWRREDMRIVSPHYRGRDNGVMELDIFYKFNH